MSVGAADGVAEVDEPAAEGSELFDDGSVVEVVLVDVGSAAGLLSLPPQAIASAASVERTRSFFIGVASGGLFSVSSACFVK